MKSEPKINLTVDGDRRIFHVKLNGVPTGMVEKHLKTIVRELKRGGYKMT